MSEAENPSMAPEELLAALEAVLFAADEPLPVRRLVRALERYLRRDVEAGLRELQRRYNRSDRGVELIELGGGWQLFSKRPFVRAIERTLTGRTRSKTRLSNAALETLAIVAYRQPVTRGEIEAIRGVDCSGTLASLSEHDLIEIVGRADSAGRPNLYGTTDDFLNYFGLRHLGELPPPEQELLEIDGDRRVVLAIDGPAGSGKSTVARLAATRLDLVYIDTGAFYRVLTWSALDSGVDLDDPAALVELARNARLELGVEDGVARLKLDGRPVGAEIRTPKVTTTIKKLADLPPIRDLVNSRIRQLAAGLSRGVVAEGRDIGSMLFPDTPYKVYLTASVDERARRRLEDHKARGEAVSLPELEKQIIDRDRADTTRDYGALRELPDAARIDTTGMTIQEVVEAIVAVVEARRADLDGKAETEAVVDEEDDDS